jgi:8-oxo-dGTP pyrophosphatase MutT (NUDIX family)
MSGFEESYVGQLRKVLGNQQLITPGARGVVLDGDGRILLIRRRDNHLWAIPAGSIELDESIYDCLRREIEEETGLKVISATPIAIYTEPRFIFENAFKEIHQMFAVVFRVDNWIGTLLTETSESIDARFFDLDDLPTDLSELYRETIEDLKKYDGNFILK